MPSLALHSIAIAAGLLVIAAVFAGPVNAPAASTYQAVVKATSGAVAVAGSLCLAMAVGRTLLLRPGGRMAFKTTYVATIAMCGLGMSEALSAFRPVNMGYALAAYCTISIVSGVFWARFYGRDV